MKTSVIPTVMISTMGMDGEFHCGKALLSFSHDANMITRSFVKDLGVRWTEGVRKAFKFNGKTLWTFGTVRLDVRHYTEPLDFYVVAHFNYVTPAMEVDPRFVTSMTLPVHLADADYHIPRGIDCILGSDVSIKCSYGESQEYSNGLILLDTVFGKVVSGVAHSL